MANIGRKKPAADWLIQGVLTKVGDTFDRLTGRRWRPSSSLATSGLIEMMKTLMDREAVQTDDGRTVVPHNIKLKMQWDKFSTDSEEALRKLEAEFLIAAVDHINDRHYYTSAPLSIEVKPDYFTDGVKLFISFERFTDDESDAQVNVSLPGVKIDSVPHLADEVKSGSERNLTVAFSDNGKDVSRTLEIQPGQRLTIGRTKENNFAIDNVSVSKYHASLMIDDAGRLWIADTGSTNGTFIGDERISYGKAMAIGEGEEVKLGSVRVRFEVEENEDLFLNPRSESSNDAEQRIGEFTLIGKTEQLITETRPTEPAVTAVMPSEANTDRPATDRPAADKNSGRS